MSRTSHSSTFLGIASRTALVAIGALCMTTPAAAQEAEPAPAVMHACYVPLTGTVYRIKETGLRSACSSTSHIEFQWTDGEGALRPTGAAAGDILQFDGTQWKPVSAPSAGGGGVTGYEVVSQTASNSYVTPFPVFVSISSFTCNVFFSCARAIYVYRTTASATTTTLACPAGKKAFGVFAPNAVGTDVLPDGRVNVITPFSQRETVHQVLDFPLGVSPSLSQLPNQISNSPSTAPDVFTVKLICANAS